MNRLTLTKSEQVDIDKIYLETHRDAFIVDEKVLVKVKNFFQKQGLEVGGGITYTISEPSDFETYSYARPADRQKVREIAEYTAKPVMHVLPTVRRSGKSLNIRRSISKISFSMISSSLTSRTMMRLPPKAVRVGQTTACA